MVFGAASGITAVDLGTLGTGGFKIIGEAGDDRAGISVSSAGDVNGDGFDDLIVGATGNGTNGAAYVVFGAASGITSVDLGAIALGTGGFKIIGEASGDGAGGSVSSAGDVNGDGFDDLIVGAVSNAAGGTDAGAAYVVFGAASGLTSVSLGTIAGGTGGFKIIGENSSDSAGFSVSSAGDVNGDGVDDLIIGAVNGEILEGLTYVVFGAADGLASVDLDAIAAGNGGFKITGELLGDLAGYSVSAAGDVDGDGFDDLLVGAKLNSGGGGLAGAAYVVFGGDFTNQVDFLGTTGNDMLTGTGADEILIGGQGDDTIDGGAGDDVIIGGSGHDTIIYDAADTLKVDAGTGTDILSVAGSGVTLNLVAIDDHVFEGFERIDLTGSGNNSLTLRVSDIYAITEGLNADTSTGNTLIVDGIAGDSVDAGAGWTLVDAAVNIGGQIYTEYTQAAATLLVDNDIDQTLIFGTSPPALVWDGSTDSVWATGANWDTGSAPVDGDAVTIPNVTNSATYSTGTVTLASLALNGETLTISGGALGIASTSTFDATSTLNLTGGELGLVETLNLDGAVAFNGGAISGGTVQTSGTTTSTFANNAGNTLDAVTWNGDFELATASGQLHIQGGLTLNAEDGVSPGTVTLSGASSLLSFSGTQSFDDATIDFDAISGGTKSLQVEGAGAVLTLGSGVTVQGGRGQLISSGAAAMIVSMAVISANVSAETITIASAGFDNQGTITLSNGGAVIMTVASADYTSSGTINILDGGDLTINFSGATPTFTNEATGVINIENVSDTSQLVLNGVDGEFINEGIINGSGGIAANDATFTNNGTLNAGLSPGTITIEGDLFQGEDAVFNIELAGTTPGSEHDQIVVTGEIEWNGTINVVLLDGYEPEAGDSFAIVTAASTTGDLDHLHGLRYGDDMVLGTDFSDTGLTLTALQASVENTGGSGDDTLTGGLGDDVMIGNDGDDIIVGGGMDHLYGDAGDDLLVVGGADFARVDGGEGNDTLAIDGDLDLGMIRGDQIEGIEEIDFTGVGNNLLVLDAENVKAFTDGVNTKADNAALHAKNSLVVTGDAGDTVDLDQFADTGVDTAVGGRGGYSVYENADASAQVLVANEVTVV